MKVPLDRWHTANAKMVNFAGFNMPVLYNKTGILKEHLAVRNNAGIFDVSHMGRMIIRGKDALSFLNAIVPRDLTKLVPSQSAYTFILNEMAGFKDDVVVTYQGEKQGAPQYFLVWNAGCLYKIKRWLEDLLTFQKHLNPGVNVELEDISSQSAMFAVQGPKTDEILKKVIPELPNRWRMIEYSFEEITGLISGTGYTGENGYEVIVLNTSVDKPQNAEKIWNAILEAGQDAGFLPCGLGARDSLRLEAGYCLSGFDIGETINPLEADFYIPGGRNPPFIHVDKSHAFFGQQSLKELATCYPPPKKRIGFIAEDKGIPRAKDKLLVEGKEVGYVTSGVYSPLLEIGIGMGYIDNKFAAIGTKIEFQGRKRHPAVVKPFPLYDPDKYGAQRK
ncbi:MAG: glycine cleavage system aminomethyltransferase GcvT [Candidatus Hermodarchaeota archaeon]